MKDEAYGLLMLNSKDETFKTLTDTWHGSDGKKSACNAKDLGSIPGSGRSPGERNGNSLYDSCLENPVDRGAWQATDHEVTESDMTERLTQVNTVKTLGKGCEIQGSGNGDVSQSPAVRR